MKIVTIDMVIERTTRAYMYVEDHENEAKLNEEFKQWCLDNYNDNDYDEGDTYAATYCTREMNKLADRITYFKLVSQLSSSAFVRDNNGELVEKRNSEILEELVQELEEEKRRTANLSNPAQLVLNLGGMTNE